ncbi:MAG TPA: DNA polymerase III subunit delta [Candidatus Dojkabacteria bacterium]|nr:DNA polymerase III subunit delta [Candidatus Dojkabacteria bacterium]
MIYLYHGEEKYLSTLAVKELSNSLSPIEIINAETLTPTAVIEKLTTQDMFGGAKNFVIKRIYSNKEKDKLIPAIIDLLKKEEKSSQTYIFWEDSKVKSNTKLFKYIDSLKGNNEYKALNKRQFVTWLNEIIKEKNIKISKTAIDLLASRVNYNSQKAINELEKLTLLEIDGIEEKDIKENVAQTLEQKIWDLTDAINQKDKKRTMEIYSNLFSNQVDPFFMIAMITRNYRLIYLTKQLYENGKTDREIPGILRIPPFTFYPILHHAKNIEYSTLKNIYEKLTNLDYLSKTGELDPSINLPLLLLKIN